MKNLSSSITFETEYAKHLFDQFADTLARDLSRAPEFGLVSLTFQVYKGRIFRMESNIQKNFKSYEEHRQKVLDAESNTPEAEGASDAQ